jgi:hypothetical protein
VVARPVLLAWLPRGRLTRRHEALRLETRDPRRTNGIVPCSERDAAVIAHHPAPPPPDPRQLTGQTLVCEFNPDTPCLTFDFAILNLFEPSAL